MADRTIDDQLREEYFKLLPQIRRVAEQLETEIRYSLMRVALDLAEFEQIEIRSRIKECQSAINALRRRQEGATFDIGRRSSYTLTDLKDLAGVRVLVFPRRRINGIEKAIRRRFSSWTPDHVPSYEKGGELLALKYFGFCTASSTVRGEFQIVPMLTGLFWDVEHSAIYKPAPALKGIDRNLAIRKRRAEVIEALRVFEGEFEKQLSSARPRRKKPVGSC